jgi:hypothetical protein
VFIRMFWLGMVETTPFNSAQAECADGSALSTLFVSRSTLYGNSKTVQDFICIEI